MTRAQLDRQPRAVAGMFDAVAPRYDLMNDVLSLGMDRRWRRATFAAIDPVPGDRILDLAAGTGTSTVDLAQVGCLPVACDFSLGMLSSGRRRHPGLVAVAGDATRLPFADASFDAVTVSFGLRNVVDVPGALAEMLRVTRPGGRLVICEFSRPHPEILARAYEVYLARVLPTVARALSSDPGAYSYLGETIRTWPAQRDLARTMAQVGWREVAWRDLTGGIVALHRARRPQDAPSAGTVVRPGALGPPASPPGAVLPADLPAPSAGTVVRPADPDPL